MIEKLPEPFQWKDYIPWAVAIILAMERFGRWAIDTYRGWGKPKADIQETRARTAKELAEADEITVRASLTLGEEASQWTRKMMRAQTTIFDLQFKNEQLEKENKRLAANQRQTGS